MAAVPRNVHLLDSRGHAGDYRALCWPVMERLTAAVLISRRNTAEAARGS